MTVTTRYVFVGERRSAKAIAMGVTWYDGRLAAKTLHDALRAMGLVPLAQHYFNLFRDGEGPHVLDRDVLRSLQFRQRSQTIVAMGQRVTRELQRAGVACLSLIHPAARGLIRKKERYYRHVRQVLRKAKAHGSRTTAAAG